MMCSDIPSNSLVNCMDCFRSSRKPPTMCTSSLKQNSTFTAHTTLSLKLSFKTSRQKNKSIITEQTCPLAHRQTAQAHLRLALKQIPRFHFHRDGQDHTH